MFSNNTTTKILAFFIYMLIQAIIDIIIINIFI